MIARRWLQESERQSLLSEPLASEVAAQVSMVRRTHEAFMKPLQFCTTSAVGQEVCDFRTWQWAWAVTWSRALAVPFGGDGRPNSTNTLIPLLDMANHQTGAATRLHWSVRAIRPPLPLIRNDRGAVLHLICDFGGDCTGNDFAGRGTSRAGARR
jgi:hypothetical protein